MDGMISNQDIIQIARRIAQSNGVSLSAVEVNASWLQGEPAIEIMLILSATITPGTATALTVAHIVQQLADQGEERFPIVRWDVMK